MYIMKHFTPCKSVHKRHGRRNVSKIGTAQARIKAGKAEAGVGFWGGAVSPSPPAIWGMGSAVSSPSGVSGTAAAENEFDAY